MCSECGSLQTWRLRAGRKWTPSSTTSKMGREGNVLGLTTTKGGIGSNSMIAIYIYLLSGVAVHAMNYDFIIVGSGSAGSVVVNRISEDCSIQVLLLEAGDWPRLISNVPFLSEIQRTSAISWNYTTVPQKNAAFGLINNISLVPRGKVMGGSSSVNDNYFTRGNKNDYNNWAEQGAVGWDWGGVFPYFLKQEDNGDPEIANNGYHSVCGDQPINTPSFQSPLTEAYLEAAERMGYRRGDYNGENQTVFMVPQGTIKNGTRWSGLKSFIEPIIGRCNLTVITSAHVTKILINENNRAYGVSYVKCNEEYTAIANEEVILCAGVFNSPQLLMLSGIGPKDQLEKFNITVLSDLPVGKNLHDHPTTLGQIFTTNTYTYRDGRITKDDYNSLLSFGIGPLGTIQGAEAVGFINTKYNKLNVPDAELVWRTLPVAQDEESFRLQFNANKDLWESLKPYAKKDITTCYAVLEHPKSIGEVTLASANPFDFPIINPKYYEHPEDIKTMVEAMKFCLEMASQEPMRRKGVRSIPVKIPGCKSYKAFSDEYLACVARVAFTSYDHHSGTCKMGDPNDPTTVVDPFLRVKGIKSLRVIDSSIMPSIITGHTHGPTAMIGEKGAAIVLQDFYSRRDIIYDPLKKTTCNKC